MRKLFLEFLSIYQAKTRWALHSSCYSGAIPTSTDTLGLLKYALSREVPSIQGCRSSTVPLDTLCF